MDPTNITKIMQASANDAVLFAKEYGIELDHSVASLVQVQEILTELRQKPLDDKELFTLSYIFGAYMGEIFIAQHGGTWLHQEEDGDEPPQTFVINSPYSYAFPGVIYQTLTLQTKYSLIDYFAQISLVYDDE